MPETAALREAITTLNEAGGQHTGPGRLRIRLIEGDVQGSSGYYPAEVLKRDGPRVFRQGMHAYVNHPTVSEGVERPERSVLDLAGRLTTDARYDGDGLYAEMEIFPHYRDLIEGMADAIGMSIRAYGTAEASTDESVRGPVITALTEGISVDFVTAAGAGGKIVELLESARTAAAAAPRPLAESRNIGAWMESRIHSGFTGHADTMYGEGRITRDERIGLSKGIGEALDAFTAHVTSNHPQLYQRDLYDGPADGADHMSENARRTVREGHGMTANDLSTALSDAVRETYGGEGIFTWVRDNTDEWVVFSVEDDTDCDLYQQTYTVDGTTGQVTLTGEPVEVQARTTYVPAPAEAGGTTDSTSDAADEAVTENAPGAPPADEKKEGGMPEITEEQARQLAEAESVRAQLQEAQAKLAEATQQVAESAAVAGRVDELEKRLAESDARNAEAEARNQRLENDRTARAQVAEALNTSGLPTFTHSRVTEAVCRDLPTIDGGGLDTGKLTEAITAEVDAEKAYLAAVAESTGAGIPRGLGETATVSDDDIDKQLEESFKRLGLTEDEVATAARGRGI